MESHLCIQVEWKNSEISLCTTDKLKKKNPFISLPYVMKRKLSNHPHFQWIMKYAKEKDNVTKFFKVYAIRMKQSSKEPKFKFGIQVILNHNQAKQTDSYNKDYLREEAEGKEIGSLEKHSTFIVLEDGEPIPE